MCKDQKRFILITDQPEEFPITEKTQWWYDTARPISSGAPFIGQPFIAVEVYIDKDPNDYVPIGDMTLLYTDQAEYYVVCIDCFDTYCDMQWSGSTSSFGWVKASQEYLAEHANKKGWCQFCDPVFGSGGWRL